ncbi:hypothetical protein BGX34_003525, partial [Mortierella sp. NVP85]
MVYVTEVEDEESMMVDEEMLDDDDEVNVDPEDDTTPAKSRRDSIEDLLGRITVPRAWWQAQTHGSPQPFDPEYDVRLRRAAGALKDTVFRDNLDKLHRTLLDYGLVPLTDNASPTASIQTQTARAIVKLVQKEGVELETGCGPLASRQSELVLFVAAQRFDVEIALFSSRKQLHWYKPLNKALFSVGIVLLKDRFVGTSQYAVLVSSRTKPAHRVLAPPVPPNPSPVPKYQKAEWRDSARPQIQNRFDHTRDVDSFHQACIDKIHEDVKVKIDGLIRKKAYKDKDDSGKLQEQQRAYEALRTRYMSGSTIPNGIMDKAVLLTGETSVTKARKGAMQPRESKVRHDRWKDIVRSVLFNIWHGTWESKSEDAVIEDSSPPHTPMFDYNQFLTPTQPNASTSDSSDSLPQDSHEEPAAESSGKDIRTCSVTFNNIIRDEHRISKKDEVILDRIESTQLSMSYMIHELYTIAHMATLLIAQGQAHSEADGVAPHVGFDLRRLVPQDFRPSEDNTHWNVPVAPITQQTSIETGASSPDDRYKLLGQENLKFWFARLLSPGERATAGDSHPLWRSLLEDIRASGYVFQKIPSGLTSTAQLHIQQAATSIGNLWSGSIYAKSFKHLVKNALRLRLAPERFRKWEARGRARKAVNDQDPGQDETKSDTRNMPQTQRTYLISSRLDELAEVCRRDDFSDDKTYCRIQGIMLSLQRLKGLERRVSDQPSLIPKLSIRQKAAVAKALEEKEKKQDHEQQQLQQTQWNPPTATQKHLLFDSVTPDDNKGNVDETMDAGLDDDDTDSDFADDDDGALLPDEEDYEMAVNEFDKHYEPQEPLEQDIEDVISNNNTPIQETKVETSGKQIHRLFTVAKILIHSPHITHNVSNNNVRRALLKNMDATDKELSAVRDVVNWLRPFAPKRVQTDNGYRNHTGHVVLCAPMVLIAQAFFDIVGLHKFKRRMCPQVSVGSTMSLQLSSVVLYELFGTNGEGQFDIQGSNGTVITTAADAANSSNKEAVIASIFDLDKVQAICNDHNLEFGNRLVFQDRLSLRLQGTLIPHGPKRDGYPVVSEYERRKEKSQGRGGMSWIWSQEMEQWSSLNKTQVEKAAEDSALISKSKAAELKASKTSKSDPAIVNRLERELALAKKEAYYWAKLEKASKSKQDGMSAPTPFTVSWDNHRVEEEPSRIRLGSLVGEAEEDPRKMVSWAGGDPGIRVMLEVVPQTTKEVKAHLSRFSCLQDLADTQQTDNVDLITDDRTAQPPPIHIDRLKKATRASANHLQEVSLTRTYMRKREKRFGGKKKKKKEPKEKQRAEVERQDITMKDDGEGESDDEKGLDDEALDSEGLEEPNIKDPVKPSKTASEHMKIISKPGNSPLAARSLEDVARISSLRREAYEPLRVIESSKRLLNLHHSQEIQEKVSKTRAAGKLKEAIENHSAHPDPPVGQVNRNNGYCKDCRQHHSPTSKTVLTYPNQCAKNKPDNVTVFAYGAAGSGVGSTIGGHIRWGGHWMREELLRLGLVVALTDEYCTSKTCVFCFERLKQQKSRRLVGTDVKTRTIHGSV